MWLLGLYSPQFSPGLAKASRYFVPSLWYETSVDITSPWLTHQQVHSRDRRNGNICHLDSLHTRRQEPETPEGDAPANR